ncbi:tetratricopeptide repeat protein [Pontiella sulfatireligans]|uniref:Uncharacterized protein n=1 Tax=Pontiella sulfatireligans TaxID=2750658 RepID=A0A6C2UR51_9BACT|nr:tetratricopeptide repeat protein [Pontiella sulfatireligans]VGO22792.1 hypothetical protein SCARR_04889 [Pontiella sulfatireligans]
MKTIFAVIAALFLASLPAAAFEKDFIEAQTAYDEGRYSDASMLYADMVSNGVDNVALQYNLANALFKGGDLPEAIWHYRKAYYAAPRDPDIGANMHFALNAAGAIEPAPSLIQRSLATLSQNEWIVVAVGAYAAMALLLILALLIPAAKRNLSKLSLLPVALILLSAAGWWQWKQLEIHPEWVVVNSGATTLYGPVTGSTAHFKVPLGALVRQKSVDPKGWIEIEYDGTRGWLERKYIKRVSP